MPINYVLVLPDSTLRFNPGAAGWIELLHVVGFALLFRQTKQDLATA